MSKSRLGVLKKSLLDAATAGSIVIDVVPHPIYSFRTAFTPVSG